MLIKIYNITVMLVEKMRYAGNQSFPGRGMKTITWQ